MAETNPAQTAIFDNYFEGGTVLWERSPAFCGEMANLRQRYGQLLANTVWPPQYQAQVTDVITKNSLVTQLYYSCSRLPGTGEYQSPFEKQATAAEAETFAAVSTLRAVLGLPLDEPYAHR